MLAQPRRDSGSHGGRLRSLWSSLKRKPSYPHYTKSSDIRDSISAPSYDPALLPASWTNQPLYDLPLSLAPEAASLHAFSFPPIPARSTSHTSPLCINKRQNAASPPPAKAKTPFYALKAFSTTHLHLGSVLSAAGRAGSTDSLGLAFPALPPRPTHAPVPVLIKAKSSLYSLKSFSTTHLHLGSPRRAATGSMTDLHFPDPPPRPPRSPSRASGHSRSRAEDTDWLAGFPTSAPQLAALPLLPPICLLDLPSFAKRPSIPEAIPESPTEEDGPFLGYTLTLGTAHASRGLVSPSMPPPLYHPQWSRSEIALSSSSLHSSDESDAGGTSGDSSAGCRTPRTPPMGHMDEEEPLSPWRVSPLERRKGSLVFPSRKNSSCISLGTY